MVLLLALLMMVHGSVECMALLVRNPFLSLLLSFPGRLGATRDKMQEAWWGWWGWWAGPQELSVGSVTMRNKSIDEVSRVYMF